MDSRAQWEFESAEADEIFARAREGDLAAFEALMRRHERQVLGSAYRMLGRMEDAQDAAQEVFLRLHRYLHRLNGPSELAPWLYRVTLNLCRDVWRRRKIGATVNLMDLEGSAVQAATSNLVTPEAQAIDAERMQWVRRGLSRLSVKERAALVLREIEGLSTREVSEILGCRETTVRSRISGARLKLKGFLENTTRRRP